MNVREATFEDMGNILDFLEKYHETSNLSDIPFDRRSCAKIVEYAIAAKDTVALVAEELSADSKSGRSITELNDS